jgi:putative redox protein
MKATIESIGRVGSRVRVGDHELVFDQPRSVPGGEDRGPSPLDVMVVSVAACAHYFAAAYLHGRGLPTDGLTVEVDAEKDRMPVSRIARLAVRVKLPGGLSEKQRAGVERAVKSCPAYGTLLHSPSVEIAIDGGGPPVAEAQIA